MIHEPKNLTTEQKKRICEVQRYKNGGGTISCGHDFWDHSKDKPSGDIFLCTRCSQYFVKANGLPWWKEGSQDKDAWEYQREPRSCHLVDRTHWFYPIQIRLQDCNGNDAK